MLMTVYMCDAEAFAKLDAILRDLYGYGEILTDDRRRDLAHRLGLFRDGLAAHMEQHDFPASE